MAARRLSYWIVHVLKRERQAYGFEPEDVARILHVHPRTIQRLEDGETHTLGPEIDRVIAAYGYLLGLDDSRELWYMALDAWKRYGAEAAPEFSLPDGLPGEFARAIRDAAQRQRAKDAAHSSARNATPKNRAAG